MDQCRNSRSELLPIVAGVVEVIPNRLQIFELFIPKAFITDFFIPQKKKNMAEGRKLPNYGELLVWIILWFRMATIQIFSTVVFWINNTIDPSDMAIYHLSDILPWNHFKYLLKALNITEKKPSYKYSFWELRQITYA